jgi:hypothetical protein
MLGREIGLAAVAGGNVIADVIRRGQGRVPARFEAPAGERR